jgi:hypothetical protein
MPFPRKLPRANAPVDYPQLWDIWTFDWVQWNGSAQQPMARNIGEALGVGATLTFFDSAGQPLRAMRATLPACGCVTNLIEETLQRLKPPDLARRTVRRHRQASGRPRSRTVQRKLRRLPRAAGDSRPTGDTCNT